jgi:hypothetical protein
MPQADILGIATIHLAIKEIAIIIFVQVEMSRSNPWASAEKRASKWALS